MGVHHLELSQRGPSYQGFSFRGKAVGDEAVEASHRVITRIEKLGRLFLHESQKVGSRDQFDHWFQFSPKEGPLNDELLLLFDCAIPVDS
jgi:hypothetical protein